MQRYRDAYVFPNERLAAIDLPRALRPPSLLVLSAGSDIAAKVCGSWLRFVWVATYLRERDADQLQGCVVRHPQGDVRWLFSTPFSSAATAAVQSLELLAEPFERADDLRRFLLSQEQRDGVAGEAVWRV
ncbi:MAG TPA: hypothetical protein VGG29_20870 [Caulobacteraceae bacterium]|jgi:hypothetical protein